ncbi:MAG TPA: DNA-deoxyinosine glycosylase [Pseudomonadales bacterium]|jgi:double-stranded uracil-DNA glycosylase|nr:DNA-deoxyinosine glycosylase [Pseudomonadales bacterium]
MARVRSFPPIEDQSARTLILGTMPGVASLAAGQYYAHPRNAFWTILADLLGFDPSLAYVERTQRLIGAGIALWDVLRSCERRGSLDSKIDRTSVVANDFARFFEEHPCVDRVFFNGGNAEALYRRHVSRTLVGTRVVSHMRLPSTSPANASIAAAAKAEAWRVAIAPTGVRYAAFR